MLKDKITSKEENDKMLIDFINDSEDSDTIDMSVNTDKTSKVGCILVQYGQACNMKDIDAGWTTIQGKGKNTIFFSEKISTFIEACADNNITTFKQAKQILQNER